MPTLGDMDDGTVREQAQDSPVARVARSDTYLKSMLLGLIEDSYLHTGTFTQFASEVLKVLAYAVTVPVAFTEGFLRAYLSIDRIEETVDGHIKIVPKVDASVEDMIRDVDQIMAQVDPGAVYNPVVRSKLDAVHEASSKVMKYDLNELSGMPDDKLMDVLRQMQADSERLQDEEQPGDESTDYIRAKLNVIRKNMRQFQAQSRSSSESGAEQAGGNGGAPDAPPATTD